MRVAIIPARGGSKRIPRKNIKLFRDKPIIAYSIEAAMISDCFDKIIVSTDDQEIADIARQYGALTPFIRPTELSDDFATTVDVIKHCLSWFTNQEQPISDICCIYATAPFLSSQTIQQGMTHLTEHSADYSFTVTTYPFPIQRALQINTSGTVQMLHPEQMNTRSQDLTEAYHDAGQLYWGRAEAFLRDTPLFSSSSKAIVLPSYKVQDIDTLDDWTRAEVMHEALERMQLL